MRILWKFIFFQKNQKVQSIIVEYQYITFLFDCFIFSCYAFVFILQNLNIILFRHGCKKTIMKQGFIKAIDSF